MTNPEPPAAGRERPHARHVAAVTIEIDPNGLRGYTDQRLALCWHVAQANPAPYSDRQAGDLTAKIGWEIIRRWLGSVAPELYHHQPGSYYWDQLRKFAKYEPGGPSGTPEFHDGQWVAKEAPDA